MQNQGGYGYGGFPQQAYGGYAQPTQDNQGMEQQYAGMQQGYDPNQQMQMDPMAYQQQQYYQQAAYMQQGMPGYPPQQYQMYGQGGFPPQYVDPNMMQQQQMYMQQQQMAAQQAYQYGAFPQYGMGMPGYPPVPGQGYPVQGFQEPQYEDKGNLLQETEQFPSLGQQNITQESLARQQRQKQLKQQISVADSLARNTGLGSEDNEPTLQSQIKAPQASKPGYGLTKSQKKQLKKQEKEMKEKAEQERKMQEEQAKRAEEDRIKKERIEKQKRDLELKKQQNQAKKAQEKQQQVTKEEPQQQTEQQIPKPEQQNQPEVLKAIKEESKINKLPEEQKQEEQKQEKEEEEQEDEEDEEDEEDQSDEENSLASDEEYVTDSEEEDAEEEKKQQAIKAAKDAKLNVTATEWVPLSLRHEQKEHVNFAKIGVNINEEDRFKIEESKENAEADQQVKKTKKKKKKIKRKKPKKPIVKEDVDLLKIVDPDEIRQPCNIVFIGHVDVGKSTICGNILLLTGKIDERTIQKYEQEAKDKGRDSWWLAYIMDINEEERQKGKTVEVGRAHFETSSKRFTILDAPGHEKYVPNMIQGACQADYGALVISARIDEFESGFDRGGQTREHAVLAKSLGIEKIIVCVNKMDDPSVDWSESRFNQIKTTLEPFLEQLGYNLQRDIFWVPISGINGINITQKSEEQMKWYKGPCFFELLDSLDSPVRYQEFLRVPIIDRMKAEVGVQYFGKIESGKLNRNQEILIYPIGTKCNVQDIYTIYDSEDQRLSYANAGENIRFKLNTSNKTISRGYVICNAEAPVPIVTKFEANMQIIDHVEHKPIMSAGYQCILHVHTAMEECWVHQMLFDVDIKTRKTKKITFAKEGQYIIAQIEVKNGVCMEVYKNLPYFGRFTLRDEGKTIAIGKVTKIIEGKEPEGDEDEEEENREEEEDEEEEEEENPKEGTGNAEER